MFWMDGWMDRWASMAKTNSKHSVVLKVRRSIITVCFYQVFYKAVLQQRSERVEIIPIRQALEKRFVPSERAFESDPEGVISIISAQI